MAYPAYGKASVDELVGQTLTSVTMNADKDEIRFVTDRGVTYLMHHFQDCCESVRIEEVVGNFEDLIGTPILRASEDRNECGDRDKEYTTHTWTFYNFATVRGYVTLRWLGESNGYYSERVDFVRLTA